MGPFEEHLKNSQDDLIKIEHFRIEDVKHIFGILKIEKHFTKIGRAHV